MPESSPSRVPRLALRARLPAPTRLRRWAAAVLGLAAAFGCSVDAPAPPLHGVRPVGAWSHVALAGGVALDHPVAAPLWIDVERPLDASTVAGAVALVRWDVLAPCDLRPVCDEGSCVRGACVATPLTASRWGALDRGEGLAAAEGAVPVHVVLADGPLGSQQRLIVTPTRPLAPHARYTLALGAALRGGDGTPIATVMGGGGPVAFELVTAGEGSSGPQPRLAAPAPGTVLVPPNLAAIDVRFARPVEPSAALVSGALELRAREDASRVVLTSPQPCPGWVPGSCLRWPLTAALPPARTWTVAAGGGWLPPHDVEWFQTAASADVTPPKLGAVAVDAAGPCIVVRWMSDEPVRATLTLTDPSGGSERVAATAEVGADAVVELATRTDAAAGDVLGVALEVADLAGNVARWSAAVAAGPGFAPDLPAVAITEVLANPAGPEPAQEFVELVALAPAQLEGLWLVDLPWPEVATALAGGDDPPGDPLPPIELATGARAVIVAASYDPDDGRDVAPAPGTIVIRVGDGSLGDGGLANAGDPVTLYRAAPAAPISTYGDHLATDASSFSGRSVARRQPHACDVASAWTPHPGGGASPGAAP